MNEQSKKSNADRLDRFLGDALYFAEKGMEGEKIAEAAKKGFIKTEMYVRKPDDAYDERIRTLAREVIFAIWNAEKRDGNLKEIYEGVRKKINADMEAGEWSRIWLMPSKRTVDRRINELAELNIDFWGDFEVQPCIAVRPGHYRPNPALFSEEIRKEIGEISQK